MGIYTRASIVSFSCEYLSNFVIMQLADLIDWDFAYSRTSPNYYDA